MNVGKVLVIVGGGLLLLIAIGLLTAGAGLGLAHLTQTDDGGYMTATVDDLDTGTAAIVAEDIVLTADPETPGWVRSALGADVRVVVDPAGVDQEVFVGIAPQRSVAAFLGGVAHARIVDFQTAQVPVLEVTAGAADAIPPGDESFWAASASGRGTQTLEWAMTDGEWSIVVMNADGSPGVTATATVGLKLALIKPLVGILITAALLVAALGIVAVVRAIPTHSDKSLPHVPELMEQI